MNWIKENKFLAGFNAALIIAAGALVYLLYSAYGSYADVTDQYTQQANELHRLQSLTPYPDEANLVKYRAERDDLIDATGTLASTLSQMVLPVEEMTPSAFQDRLRDTLSAVVARAGQTGVKLPDRFSMDFEKYQSEPPPAAAAGPLGRQLAALQIVMNILIDDHVDSVTSLERTPLAQEGGGAAGGGARTERGGGRFGGRGGGGAGGAAGGGNLVEKIPFEIRFTGNQPSFQKVLNDLAASSKQFFITRTLVVQNTDPKPVSKNVNIQIAPVQVQAVPAAAAPGAPGSPEASGESRLTFIVGTEKLNVAMRIDMVAFNPPEKSTRK